MTIDAYFTFFALAFAAILGAILGWSLWTGRIRHAGDVYLRRTAPSEFWMEAATYFLIITILLAGFLLARAWDRATDRSPPWGVLTLLAIIGSMVLRSLWSGEARLGNVRRRRGERPVAYWSLTLCGVALCICAVAILLITYPA